MNMHASYECRRCSHTRQYPTFESTLLNIPEDACDVATGMSVRGTAFGSDTVMNARAT